MKRYLYKINILIRILKNFFGQKNIRELTFGEINTILNYSFRIYPHSKGAAGSEAEMPHEKSPDVCSLFMKCYHDGNNKLAFKN